MSVEHKYPVGYKYSFSSTGVWEVMSHTPPHHVIEQLEYVPHYRVKADYAPSLEITVSEEEIDEGIPVAEEKSGPKYKVGRAYRSESSQGWYLVSNYNESDNLYSIEWKQSKDVYSRIEQSTLDSGNPIEVDWETGLREDEMRVSDLKLGSKFFLVDGIQVWEVTSLETVKDPVIVSRSSSSSTRVFATTKDGGHTINHKFTFSPHEILLKPKESK